MIKGLEYIKDYLNQEQHDYLLNNINNSTWSNELSRRVQHYGYKYVYTSRKIDASMKAAEIPIWANKLGNKLFVDGYYKYLPDQVIINEYKRGQGIGPHIDCVPCFNDTIVSVSLGSGATMVFTRTGEKPVEIYLEPKSAVILKNDARYKWKHQINQRYWDTVNGEKIARKTRISLTYRNVILKD